jgi:hypothetical protein
MAQASVVGATGPAPSQPTYRSVGDRTTVAGVKEDAMPNLSTTGPLTTGPLTTGPLTTGPLTTGALTTGPRSTPSEPVAHDLGRHV